MSLIPDYLIILIIALVIVPSIIAVFLRMALYAYLVRQGNIIQRLVYGQFSGNKPRIINTLEHRLAAARRELEQVNTAALIDHLYSQERVLLISCEQIEYLGKILPNLLLAFGLIGTFVGITINLTAISQTVSEANITDINTLLQDIQKPLQGMGIAFITSLTAILFSAFLIVINFLFNTNLAKNRFLSALEDYLDNIYQPTLKGETRIDHVVKAMVKTFDQFLERMAHGIQESIKLSLQDKLQEISATHLQAIQLSEQVHHRLVDATSQFMKSSQDLQTVSQQFIEAAQTFEKSQFPQILSQATVNLSNIQRNFSHSASNLSTSVQSVDLAMIELQTYSKRLMKFGERLNESQEKSHEILEHYGNQQYSLSEMIVQLQTSTQGFQIATNTLESLQRRLVNRTDSLEEIQLELSKVVVTLNHHTETIQSSFDILGNRLIQSLQSSQNR